MVHEKGVWVKGLCGVLAIVSSGAALSYKNLHTELSGDMGGVLPETVSRRERDPSLVC